MMKQDIKFSMPSKIKCVNNVSGLWGLCLESVLDYGGRYGKELSNHTDPPGMQEMFDIWYDAVQNWAKSMTVGSDEKKELLEDITFKRFMSKSKAMEHFKIKWGMNFDKEGNFIDMDGRKPKAI